MADLGKDIERYRKGELTPAEMHALEKRALSDPFLADALEGASSIAPENFADDVALLNRQLDRRTAAPRWRLSWQLAASLLLMVTAVVALYSVLKTTEPATLAKQEYKAPMLKPEPSSPARVDSAPSSKKATENLLTLNRPPAAGKKERKEMAAASAPAPAQPAESQPSGDVKVSDESKVEEQVVADAPPKSLLEKRGTRLSNNAAGANSALEPSAVRAMDKATDSTAAENKQNSFTTLNPRELSKIEVMLDNVPDDDRRKKNSDVLAEPAGRKNAFDEYLRQNLRYPAAAANLHVGGLVTLQFIVNADGKVSDFKIVKGIGAGCDEELIRLVREGPPWLPTRLNDVAVASIVRVSLRFIPPH